MNKATAEAETQKIKRQRYLTLFTGTAGITSMLLAVIDWNKHSLPVLQSPAANLLTVVIGVLLVGVSFYIGIRLISGQVEDMSKNGQAGKLGVATLCILAVIGVLSITVGYFFASI